MDTLYRLLVKIIWLWLDLFKSWIIAYYLVEGLDLLRNQTTSTDQGLTLLISTFLVIVTIWIVVENLIFLKTPRWSRFYWINPYLYIGLTSLATLLWYQYTRADFEAFSWVLIILSVVLGSFTTLLKLREKKTRTIHLRHPKP